MQENQVVAKFVSKSGKQVLIRSVTRSDTTQLQEVINELSLEDTYLLVSGEQFTYIEEQQFIDMICHQMLADNYIYLVAVVDGVIAGSVSVRRLIENRTRMMHVGEVGLMLRKNFRADGIGSKLLESVINEAKKMNNMRLLRLWVFESNFHAKKLYRKYGFEICGRVPDMVLYKNEYIAEELMYLSLVSGSTSDVELNE